MAGAGICDDFRPRYAVDIEIMGPDGEPDPKLPILAGVPLPLATGGEEMDIYAFPEEGTQVVVCFAYGLPHRRYGEKDSGATSERGGGIVSVWRHRRPGSDRAE